MEKIIEYNTELYFVGKYRELSFTKYSDKDIDITIDDCGQSLHFILNPEEIEVLINWLNKP